MGDQARRSSRSAEVQSTTPAGLALQTLTPRELEVLALVANGQTSRSVATTLDIKLPTVKRHLLNIYRKLGTANRVQASNVYHLGHPRGNLYQGR